MLNYLIPNSVNLSKLKRVSTLSTNSYIENIDLFLHTCKSRFGIKEFDLFDPKALIDLDIDSVIYSLSILSRSKAALSRSQGGFVLNDFSIDEIQIYITKQKEAGLYTSFDFITGQDKKSEYEQLVNTNKYTDAELGTEILFKNDLFKPRDIDYAIRELITTESAFLLTLKDFNEYFQRPLETLLSSADKKCLFFNLENIYKFHQQFKKALFDACSGGPGRTVRICEVIVNFERQFMIEYAQFVMGYNKACQRFKQLELQNTNFKNKLNECRAQSAHSSSISYQIFGDLLRLPLDRLYKYPLVLKNIFQQSNHDLSIKDKLNKTLQAMQRVVNYVNEADRDRAEIEKIDNIIKEFNIQLPNNESFKDFGRLISYNVLSKIECLNGESLGFGTKGLFLFEKCIIILKSNLILGYRYVDKLCMYDLEISEVQESSFRIKSAEKEYRFYFCDSKEKQDWLGLCESRKPILTKLENHVFSLKNLEFDIQFCSVCKEIFNGVFYQAFKCNYCDIKCHKDCITNVTPCKVNKIGNVMLREIVTPKRERLSSFSSDFYIALNNYNGIPKPPKSLNPILLFQTNEYIEVVDKLNKEWFKGIKLRYKCAPEMKEYFKEEGYFPSEMISPVDLEQEHEIYSWFLKCERDKAETILNRLNSEEDTIFMIRFRKESGFALSLKFKNKIKHLKINLTYMNPRNLKSHAEGQFKFYLVTKEFLDSEDRNQEEVASFYSIDVRHFMSLPELVDFYKQNSFEDYFPDIRTTIGKPYREAYTSPIHTVIAISNYTPGNQTNMHLDLIKDQMYFVLFKANDDIFYLVDRDGFSGYAPKKYLKIIK